MGSSAQRPRDQTALLASGDQERSPANDTVVDKSVADLDTVDAAAWDGAEETTHVPAAEEQRTVLDLQDRVQRARADRAELVSGLTGPEEAATRICRDETSGVDQVPADPLIGKVLHGFRIDGLIGEGSAALVYHASHLVLDREYAVKVLHAERGS